MKIKWKGAVVFALSMTFLLASCPNPSGELLPRNVDVLWDWDYARDGWNFSVGGFPVTGWNPPPVIMEMLEGEGGINRLPVNEGGREIRGAAVFARGAPVFDIPGKGIFLGGRNTGAARLMVGGRFAGDTTAWTATTSTAYSTPALGMPEFDLSTRNVRITVRFVDHSGQTDPLRDFLLIRINNNVGGAANGPLGNTAAAGTGNVGGIRLNASGVPIPLTGGAIMGGTTSTITMNPDGRGGVFTVVFEPTRITAANPGRETLKNAWFCFTGQNSNVTGNPDVGNYIIISGIRIEYVP